MHERPFESFEKTVIAVLLACMGLCMLASACRRHLFPGLPPFPMRVAAGLLTWIASFGMARAAALGLHTRVSFIEELVQPAARRRLSSVADIAFLIFSAFSFLAGCVVLAVSVFAPHPSSGHPIVYAAIPLGSLLTMVRLCQRLRRRYAPQSGAAP